MTDPADPAHRILYVISTLDLGGAERHLAYIAPQMLRHGFRPVVFSLNGRGALAADLEQAGVTVRTHWAESQISRLPRSLRLLLRLPLASFALLALIIRLRPQAIHMFLPAAYLLGGLASMIGCVPVRIMSRRSRNHYQRKHPVAARLEHALHRQMSALLGNSRRVVDDLIEEGGDERKICLLYNGIPLPAATAPEDRRASRVALGIEPDVLVMTITANLFAYKGHADLLDALIAAQGTLGSKWVLLCAGGDRGILSELRQRAETGGIASHVRWLGSRRDIKELLAATDIGILCSHEEGFSNAILEYMGAGLPTVVTDVGGNAEAVIDGVCGFVVPPRDVTRLANALVQLSSDPTRRVAMGVAARQRMERHFTLDVCIDKYVCLYDALLKNDGSVPGIDRR